MSTFDVIERSYWHRDQPVDYIAVANLLRLYSSGGDSCRCNLTYLGSGVLISVFKTRGIQKCNQFSASADTGVYVHVAATIGLLDSQKRSMYVHSTKKSMAFI